MIGGGGGRGGEQEIGEKANTDQVAYTFLVLKKEIGKG
jgi:hypothetical protein